MHHNYEYRVMLCMLCDDLWCYIMFFMWWPIMLYYVCYVMSYYIMLCMLLNAMYVMLWYDMWSYIIDLYCTNDDTWWNPWWVLFIHYSHVYYDMNERKGKRFLTICYDFKPRGPHAFMCIMYIRVLSSYIMLVWIRTFSSMVFDVASVRLPRRVRPWGMYASLLGGCMYACVSHVWDLKRMLLSYFR